MRRETFTAILNFLVCDVCKVIYFLQLLVLVLYTFVNLHLCILSMALSEMFLRHIVHFEFRIFHKTFPYRYFTYESFFSTSGFRLSVCFLIIHFITYIYIFYIFVFHFIFLHCFLNFLCILLNSQLICLIFLL